MSDPVVEVERPTASKIILRLTPAQAVVIAALLGHTCGGGYELWDTLSTVLEEEVGEETLAKAYEYMEQFDAPDKDDLLEAAGLA